MLCIFLQSGRSRGYCFVYFEQIEDAATAKESCANLVVDSRRVRVDYSITQRAHTPTPGIYKGVHLYRQQQQQQQLQRYGRDGRDGGSGGSNGGFGQRSFNRNPRPVRYARGHRRSRSYSPRDRKYYYSYYMRFTWTKSLILRAIIYSRRQTIKLYPNPTY